MKRHKFIPFLLLLLSCGDFANSKTIDIQGHRGARWWRPENTLPAFQFAIANGATTLELDTLITKDNQVVVAHDPFINPVICQHSDGSAVEGQIAIRNLTLKEVQAFDCGSKINPRFPNQVPVPKTSIPTLADVLDQALKGNKKIHFNIETKIDPTTPELAPDPESFTKLVFDVIRKKHALGQVTLQSFDFRTLKVAKRLAPKVPRVALVENRPAGNLVELLKSSDANILSPSYEWLKPEDIEVLHHAGFKVIPWTVNDKSEWQRLIAMGVDGIITDNPKDLAALVQPTKVGK